MDKGSIYLPSPIHTGQSWHPKVSSFSLSGAPAGIPIPWPPRSQGQKVKARRSSHPGASGLACTDLVVAAMAKVKSEERGCEVGGSANQGKEDKGKEEDTGRKQIQKALTPRGIPDQVKIRDASSRGSVEQAVIMDPQALPATG